MDDLSRKLRIHVDQKKKVKFELPTVQPSQSTAVAFILSDFSRSYVELQAADSGACSPGALISFAQFPVRELEVTTM